jgi:hypothetical protein
VPPTGSGDSILVILGLPRALASAFLLKHRGAVLALRAICGLSGVARDAPSYAWLRSSPPQRCGRP